MHVKDNFFKIKTCCFKSQVGVEKAITWSLSFHLFEMQYRVLTIQWHVLFEIRAR